MIRVEVIYPHTEGGRFDMDYYTGTHATLVITTLEPLGLLGFEVATNSDAFLVKADLFFESQEAFEQAMAFAGEALTADVATCTDIASTVQISEVLLSKR